MSSPSPWMGLRQRFGIPAALSGAERVLLRLHLISAALSGVAIGCIHLADATLAKTLHGSALQVTAIHLTVGLSYLGALFWAGAMRGRRKTPFLLAFALIGRGGLSLIGLWRDPHWFILIIGLSWLTEALIVTAQVSIIRRAYRREYRDPLFGLTISVTTLLRLLTTVALGWLLDWNENLYGLYFGIAGAIGFGGVWMLTRMEQHLERWAPLPGAPQVRPERIRGPLPSDPVADSYRPAGQPGLGPALRSMRESVTLVFRILREDHAYRRFQRNFIIYGIAFLGLLPVVPLFLVHDLQLDYRQIGLAKGLMGQAGMILFPPLVGGWMARNGPVRMCTRAFGFLSLYPLLLLAAGFTLGTLRLGLVYGAFLAFGAAMAGVSLTWHMSSVHFAREEDPSSYQAVHTFLTGARACVAPLLGYFLITFGSKRLAFIFGAGLLWLAAGLMARMARSAARAAHAPPRPPAGAGAAQPRTRPVARHENQERQPGKPNRHFRKQD